MQEIRSLRAVVHDNKFVLQLYLDEDPYLKMAGTYHKKQTCVLGFVLVFGSVFFSVLLVIQVRKKTNMKFGFDTFFLYEI